MSISLQTQKMLWGRSGNLCGFPDCKKELVMDISESGDISIVGEVAHIVAREVKGPRGDSPLKAAQRNEYDNLFLLCIIHHKIIDDHPDEYPIELLQEYKRTHENWVKQNLGLDNVKQRVDEVYASYIDEFLRFVDIENYKNWIYLLLKRDNPKLTKVQYHKFKELIDYIISRVWYKRYPDIEKALLNFKNVLNDLILVFDKYAVDDSTEEEIWTKKFYQIEEWNPERYQKLADKHDFHTELIADFTYELIRAANFIFDKVRQHLVPSFRIKEGVLLIVDGPFEDLRIHKYRVEYQPEERTDLPYPGLRKFMEIRTSRDISWGAGVCEDYFP